MAEDMHNNGIDSCPECHSFEVVVTDSRSNGRGRRRRRVCNACQNRWTTLEVNEGQSWLDAESEAKIRKQLAFDLIAFLAKWRQDAPPEATS